MYTDGFNPFKRGSVNMTLVIFAVLNLPPEIRYKEENLIVVTIYGATISFQGVVVAHQVDSLFTPKLLLELDNFRSTFKRLYA